MKRDLDLMRTIMLDIEEMEPHDTKTFRTVAVSGVSGEQIVNHVRLLIDRGYLYEDRVILHGGDINKNYTSQASPDALTNLGHDFLDSTRNPKIWTEAKSRAKSAGAFTVDFVFSIAKELVKAEIRKHLPGFDIR